MYRLSGAELVPDLSFKGQGTNWRVYWDKDVPMFNRCKVGWDRVFTRCDRRKVGRDYCFVYVDIAYCCNVDVYIFGK